MLDSYLQAFSARRTHRLLHFGQDFLEHALVNGLLDDLEHPIFDYGVAIDEARTRGDYFRHKRIGTKGICDEVAHTIDEGTTNNMEGGEERSIPIANVGECDGIVVAPW